MQRSQQLLGLFWRQRLGTTFAGFATTFSEFFRHVKFRMR
jgi:hypothetical protein